MLDVSGYDQTDGNPWMLMTAPGFANRVLQTVAPPSEAQEIDIILMMCLPEDNSPVKYADQFSIDSVTAKAIKQRDACSWQDVPDDPDDAWLRFTETFASVHRGVGSLWHRLRVYDANKNSERCAYYLADSETLQTDQTQLRIYPEVNGQMNFNMGIPLASESYKPHGDTLIAGRSFIKATGKSWIWLDGQPGSGTQSDITVSWVGAGPVAQIASACDFIISRWNGGAPTTVGCPNPIPFLVNDGTPSKPSNAVTIPDFYTVDYVQYGVAPNFPPGSDGVQIMCQSFCSVLKQIQVEGAYQNITTLGPGFNLAGSARFTNIAPPLEIEGMAAVANTREPMTWWSMYVSSGGAGANSIFGVVANYKDSYGGPLRLGGYMLDVPHTMTDYVSKSYCDVDYKINVIKDIYFDIEDTSIVNVFAAKSQNTGAWRESSFIHGNQRRARGPL